MKTTTTYQNFTRRKKLAYALLLTLIVNFLAVITPFAPAQAENTSLSGRILLQVEKNGQAWYVDPVKNTRSFLGSPSNAFQIMRSFGLGISNDNLKLIRQQNKLKKYAGRILLQVEMGGAAYYVSPTDLSLNYLGRPADAFKVMRKLALGVSNISLNKIAINPNFTDKAIIQQVKGVSINNNSASATSTTSPTYVSNGQIIAANPCTSWNYTDWNSCSPWGNQTREILTSTPVNCSGGDYILSQTCSNNISSSTTASSTATSTETSTQSIQNITNLSFDELFLSAAFSDFGKNVGATCKLWLRKVLNITSNNSITLPFQGFNNYSWDLDSSSRVLYRSTAIENVGRADVVQINMASKNNLPHTALIVTKTPTGMVWIHSNWSKTNTVTTDFITYEYFHAMVGDEYSVYHIY